MLDVPEGLRLAESLPDVECLLVAGDGRVVRSDGWVRFEQGAPSPVVPALATAQGARARATTGARPTSRTWQEDHELLVRFEINNPDPEGGRYQRPYVVVFIEDASGLSVRTVSLWVSQRGAGPDQWLPDLRRWYRGDANRSLAAKKNMAYTIGRPTRPPGQYEVIWDGKDDQGKPVARGTYSIFIEAAREHGTHQLIRTQMTLGDEPLSEELPGNVEIRSATVQYRRNTTAKPGP